MKPTTVTTAGSILPTLSLAVSQSANPDTKKCVVLSPNLQHRVYNLLRSHSDLESFMKVMNPDLQQACALHVDRAYFGTAPTLLTLRHAYHDEAATIWMLPQLYDLCEYCGVKEKLDKRQMEQLARIIATEFSYLKVTEVMLFLHRLKAGCYGHFYGAIDPMIIVTALRHDFMRERAAAIDRSEHAQARAEWDTHYRLVAKERAEARAAGRPLYPYPVTPPEITLLKSPVSSSK